MMVIWPMIFRGRAKELRDADCIARNMFIDWTRRTNMRPIELSGYGSQSVRTQLDGKLLWYHIISFVMITDRDIDFNVVQNETLVRYVALLDTANERELTQDDFISLPEFVLPPTAPVSERWVRRSERATRNIIKGQNKRAADLGIAGILIYEEWVLMCDHFDNKCAGCGQVALLSLDHVIPLSRRGTNYIENVQPLCAPCNGGKHTKTIDYRGDRAYSFLEKLELLRKSS